MCNRYNETSGKPHPTFPLETNQQHVNVGFINSKQTDLTFHGTFQSTIQMSQANHALSYTDGQHRPGLVSQQSSMI